MGITDNAIQIPYIPVKVPNTIDTGFVVVHPLSQHDFRLVAEIAKKVPIGIRQDSIKPTRRNQSVTIKIGKLKAGKNQHENSATELPTLPKALRKLR
jgi:hypothetical protein